MAISIPTIIAANVDHIVNSLKYGTDLPAPPNPQLYSAGLQMPDIIAIERCLRVLVPLLDTTSALTVSGASIDTYTVNDTGAFTASQEVLSEVTIVADPVNPANDGLVRVIRANNANSLTIYGDFAANLGAGSTYTISTLPAIEPILDRVRAREYDVQGNADGLLDAFALILAKLGSPLSASFKARYYEHSKPYISSEDMASALQGLKDAITAATIPS